MKPLVVRPKDEQKKPPGKEPARTGKSGEGAGSALEQLIKLERTRVPRNAEPPKDPPAG